MNYTTLTPDSPELQSLSPIHGNLAALQQLFPSVVREGKVDFDALRQLLGDDIAKEDELYGLQWHGKARARRNALTPSLGTLRPCKEESKNWDSTRNLYIEGDNLEVLKLLQKSYAGKVKMIYIDPPYNTGKEFVYPDNYQNGIEHYLKLTGQTDSFKANAETSGRYHTDWLNMMYPRLKVARELLSDDGYICISIDDNEFSNAQGLCNEIFGESNFVSNFIIIRSEGGGLAKRAVIGHDYLLVYAKKIDSAIPLGRPKDVRGQIVEKEGVQYWIETDWFREEFGRYGTCHYEDILIWHDNKKKEEIDEGIKRGDYILIPKKGKHIVGRFRKLSEDTSKFYTVIKHLNKNGLKDLEQIHLGDYFDFPKPISLVKEFIQGTTILSKTDNEIILDFFSGSATTAHAVMQLNAEDGGNRRFIMVQLPEACVEGSEAAKAGYKNICEIGKERIRRAGEKVKEEAGEKAEGLDIGFRVFKLDSSNVKPWDTEAGMLNMQLEQESNLRPERSSEDIFYEVLLKQGIELTEDCRTREVAGHTVYSLGYGQYYCCFDERIGDEAQELAAGIALWHAEEDPDGQSCVVYVRDTAFDSGDLMRGTQGDEGDARKKSFCLTLEQSNIMQVKAI